MVTNPGHFEPGFGGFRAQPSAGAPHDDGAPTERINTNTRQPMPPRLPSQPERRAPEQPSRVQRTRRTVDLAAPTHRALDIWQREAADRLGVARVTGQEVLSALIEQLLVDPKLTAQITRMIQARR